MPLSKKADIPLKLRKLVIHPVIFDQLQLQII
jgi:hypothetical protein